ncbi:hypothetical protein [Serratia ureilytica]|uniref:hypothetical protein n=1 Tax=Serratia ureilytica TaxID=300181 RepID=UPI001E422C13|nr:hypothetical protein [Serratia ureilytica]
MSRSRVSSASSQQTPSPSVASQNPACGFFIVQLPWGYSAAARSAPTEVSERAWGPLFA